VQTAERRVEGSVSLAKGERAIGQELVTAVCERSVDMGVCFFSVLSQFM